jgi:hypothetical protein
MLDGIHLKGDNSGHGNLVVKGGVISLRAVSGKVESVSGKRFLPSSRSEDEGHGQSIFEDERR